MIETTIVKKAIEGDAQAFGELYDSLATELYKVALYTLKNPQDAEDAVAETFLDAYKGIKNLSDETKVKNWFFTILSAKCKRQISNYIKKKDETDLDTLSEIGIEPISEDITDTSRLEVRDALLEVSLEEREIINLSVLMGYTVKEISEIIGLPQGTVSSKLYRAFKKLRAVLS